MHRRRIFVGLFMLMCGTGAFISNMGNPRVASLHGSDVMGLIASGLCVGFGLAMLLARLMFRGQLSLGLGIQSPRHDPATKEGEIPRK
jgi:hypothetical protein